jgi:hypothetical protein
LCFSSSPPPHLFTLSFLCQRFLSLSSPPPNTHSASANPNQFEEEVYRIVSGGDANEIKAWVEHSLQPAKPMEIKNAEDSTSILAPAMQKAITAVVRRLPEVPRQIFLDALMARGVKLHNGDIDDIWVAVLRGDLIAIKNWVRNLPLRDADVSPLGKLSVRKGALLKDDFVQAVVDRVMQRATPHVRQFLLDELARVGVFVDRELPVPNYAAILSQQQSSPGGRSEDDEEELPQNCSHLAMRAARAGMLFRPRPISVPFNFMRNMAPIGHFSQFHQFMVQYLSSQKLDNVLETYVAWYELQKVPYSKFNCRRADIFQPTIATTSSHFRSGQTESGLGAAMLFVPPNYNNDPNSDVGVYKFYPDSIFDTAEITFDYKTSIMSRIDVAGLAPRYETVTRNMRQMEEFKIALQYSRAPQSPHPLGYMLPNNLPSSKIDSSLFAYIYARHGFNAALFFANSPWGEVFAEILSAEEVAQRVRQQRQQSSIRDWLRHRAPIAAAHHTVTVLQPQTNEEWDGIASMAVRTALANFKPPKENPPMDRRTRVNDEFGVLERVRETYISNEMINTCFTYLDSITCRDTVDTTTLGVYLDVAEILAYYCPDHFGYKRLIEAVDLSYRAGRPLQRELRISSKFQTSPALLTTPSQAPKDIKRILHGLRQAYRRAKKVDDRKHVLRTMTAMHMLYGIQFHPSVSRAWKQLDGGPTTVLVRWFMSMASVMRMNPEQFMTMMAYSNGLFAGREEVIEHVGLLVGAPSGLLAGLRLPADEQEAVFDRTSRFLYYMPANSRLPAGHDILSQRIIDWISECFLYRSLSFVENLTEYDSVLPLLALDQGANRRDAFMVYMEAHAWASADSQFSDEPAYLPPLPVGKTDLASGILERARHRDYLVLNNALQLFYPNSCMLVCSTALCHFHGQRYYECKASFRDLVFGMNGSSDQQPLGYHMVQRSKGIADANWTTNMVEAMLRSTIGKDSKFPALGAHDRKWLRDVFDQLEFEIGIRVLDEADGEFNTASVDKSKKLTSEEIYEEVLSQFKELCTDGFMWQFDFERYRFYRYVHDRFVKDKCSPVHTGAMFFEMWVDFKYYITTENEGEIADPFTPEEEIFLLYHAVHFWRMCDQNVYAKVVTTLSARIYCLILAYKLDGFQVTVGNRSINLRLNAFFPRLPESEAAEIRRSLSKQAARAEEIDPFSHAPYDELPAHHTIDNDSSTDEDNDSGDEHLEAALNMDQVSDDEDNASDAFMSREQKTRESKSDHKTSKKDKKKMSTQAAFAVDYGKTLDQLEVMTDRMDLSGFLVYKTLKPHHYMPEADTWEEKWEDEERLEREAYQSGASADQVAQMLDEHRRQRDEQDDLDVRKFDVDLYFDVLLELIRTARFQQTYFLANDIVARRPDFLAPIDDIEQLLDEQDGQLTKEQRLRVLLDRIRLVFYVVGLDKLKSSELDLSGAIVPRRTPGGQLTRDIPEAAHLANVQWLETNASAQEAMLRRKRLAWNSATRVNVIRYLFVSLFPDLRDNLADVREKLQEYDSVQGRIDVLTQMKHADPELRKICDLFITSLLVLDQERMRQREVKDDNTPDPVAELEDALHNAIDDEERRLTLHNFKKKQAGVLAEVIGVLAEHANKGSLAVLLQISEALGVSVLKLAKLSPQQIIFEIMQRIQDMRHIKAYVRVCAPQNSSKPIKYMTEAFGEHVRRRALDKKSLPQDGWGRNRFLAFANCLAERRQMSILGHAFLKIVRQFDSGLEAGVLDASDNASLTRKFELLYAAYFCFFAAAHQDCLREVLSILDDTLHRIYHDASVFDVWIKRTLFLTAEYKALNRVVQLALEKEPSARTRAKVSRLGGGADFKHGDGNLQAVNYSVDDERLLQLVRGIEDDGYEPVVDEDLEVDLASRRRRLITQLLEALVHYDGFALFETLEQIAARCKALAWRYQSLRWYTQALQCHRISELIYVEMEYIPARLRCFNFVNPDEYDLKQLWKCYTRKQPKSINISADRDADLTGVDLKNANAARGGLTAANEAIPEFMTPEQFALLIADCALSGVSGRYLEVVRREYSREAIKQFRKRLQPRKIVFKDLHNLKEHLIDHYLDSWGGAPLRFADFISLMQLQTLTLTRADVALTKGSDDVPSTVLFFMLDRFGQWDIGVDASNSSAAQDALVVLEHTNKAAQKSIFKQYYYGYA